MVKQSVKRGGKIVAKALLVTLASGGILCVGALAPNIFVAIEKLLRWKGVKWIEKEEVREKKIIDTFSYLLKKGMVRVTFRGKQRFVSLTEKGRKRAKRLKIDLLTINRPERWDRRWRLVMFDVEEKRKVTREALRGKLKELGFYQLQKSIWVHAFPCEKELGILRDFFGLREDQYMCFEVDELPPAHEHNVLRFFQL